MEAILYVASVTKQQLQGITMPFLGKRIVLYAAHHLTGYSEVWQICDSLVCSTMFTI